FEAEECTDAVKLDVAERSVRRADRVAERFDVERDHIQKVLRQVVAGKLDAVEKVAEQHHHLALAATLLRGCGAVDRPLRAHQRNNRYVTARTQLTGEPHVGGSVDPIEGRTLVRPRAWAGFLARGHAHAARRAAR